MISLSIFSYVIWRFNPIFKWPVFSSKSTSDIQDIPLDGAADSVPEEVQPRLDLTEGNSIDEASNHFQLKPLSDPLMGPLNAITEPVSEEEIISACKKILHSIESVSII